MTLRKLLSPTVLIPVAVVVAGGATAVLLGFPESVAVRHAATWALVAALQGSW